MWRHINKFLWINEKFLSHIFTFFFVPRLPRGYALRNRFVSTPDKQVRYFILIFFRSLYTFASFLRISRITDINLHKRKWKQCLCSARGHICKYWTIKIYFLFTTTTRFLHFSFYIGNFFSYLIQNDNWHKMAIRRRHI